MAERVHDVIVIGGGPAGSTSALQLARKGLDVLLLEKVTHPRFHIGESFLPRNFELIQELGLGERLAAIPQMCKLGAEFGFGHARTPTTHFRFDMMLRTQSTVGSGRTFNIERAPFDAMLVNAARDAGAEVDEDDQVKRIIKLDDGDVRIEARSGEVRARWLIDASGQATVVGRHLNTRQVLPHLKKIAYFGHFRNVKRLPGDKAGYPTIVMCDEGWFWIIPLDPVRTSIGLVMHHHLSKRIDCPPDQMLRWAIARCPLMMQRAGDAIFPDCNVVTADFSYRCAPYAGSGHFLVGDAATFMDPIFSTGVCLAMMGGVQAADAIEAIIKQGENPEPLRKRYIKFVQGSSSVFFRMVALYYNHHFRELFLNGQGPMQVHRAVIGVLAGNVFPKPDFALRWRMRLFELFIRMQRYVPLAPRRQSFSLLRTEPMPLREPSLVIEVKHAAEAGVMTHAAGA